MENLLFEKYRNYSEQELLIAMQNGNMEVVYCIVYDEKLRYRMALTTKIRSILFNSSYGRNVFEAETWLDNVYTHITEKNKFGITRFTTIKEGADILGWFINTTRNYIITKIGDYNGITDPDPIGNPNPPETDPETIERLLESLKYISTLKKPIERYILISDILVTQHKQGTTPTYFSERMAEVLGITPLNVRTILKRAKDKMRAELGQQKLRQHGC